MYLCHFTNQAQGDSRGSKYMNFTKKSILSILFGLNTKCKWFLMELVFVTLFKVKIPNAKAIAIKGIDKTQLVKITIGLRYQMGL